ERGTSGNKTDVRLAVARSKIETSCGLGSGPAASGVDRAISALLLFGVMAISLAAKVVSNGTRVISIAIRSMMSNPPASMTAAFWLLGAITTSVVGWPGSVKL